MRVVNCCHFLGHYLQLCSITKIAYISSLRRLLLLKIDVSFLNSFDILRIDLSLLSVLCSFFSSEKYFINFQILLLPFYPLSLNLSFLFFLSIFSSHSLLSLHLFLSHENYISPLPEQNLKIKFESFLVEIICVWFQLLI